MKFPAALRKSKPLDVLRDEGAALQVRADAIAVDIAKLDATRAELVLDGEPDDVVAHDAQRARLAVELEQATARLSRLDGERAAAEREEDQARRRRVYLAAQKRRGEGIKALADYARAANAAAAALLTLADVEREVATANDSDMLPDGYDFLEPAEPDNSIAPTPDVWHEPQRVQTSITTRLRGTVAMHDAYQTPGWTSPGSPGRAHSSVLQRAMIVGLKPGEVLFGSGARFR